MVECLGILLKSKRLVEEGCLKGNIQINKGVRKIAHSYRALETEKRKKWRKHVAQTSPGKLLRNNCAAKELKREILI